MGNLHLGHHLGHSKNNTRSHHGVGLRLRFKHPHRGGKSRIDSERSEYTDKYHPDSTVYLHSSRLFRGNGKAWAKALRMAALVQQVHTVSGRNVSPIQCGNGTANWMGFDFLVAPYLNNLVNSVAPGSGGQSSVLAGVTTPALQRLTRIDIIHARHSYQINNVVNQSAYGAQMNPLVVKIWILVPRRDFAQDEYRNIIGATPIANNAGDLLKALAGFTDGVGNVAAKDQFLDARGDAPTDCGTPDFTPFMNSRFCRIFQIQSCREIILNSGENYTFEHVSKRKHFINGERVSSKDGTIPNVNMHYLKGISEVILFQIFGCGSKTYNQAYDGSGLNIECNSSCQYKYIDIQTPSIFGAGI